MYFDDFCGSGSVASTTGSGGSSQTSSTSSAPTSHEPTDNNQGNQTSDNAGSSGRITTAPMGLTGAMLVLGVYLSPSITLAD
ncbi:unnamed protein product [Parascedosporium putredinis]|uniref:Uncharacterized protein n=1 Tax=Parascedosporium putredinis TaxID=1442378 RepID=A0A9P1GYY0_9PEZI|nr:unnamed protein product [Parascedosporium putredinis]CAI7990327.1 unnamed protein product [Parascedosporium putredinis]